VCTRVGGRYCRNGEHSHHLAMRADISNNRLKFAVKEKARGRVPRVRRESSFQDDDGILTKKRMECSTTPAGSRKKLEEKAGGGKPRPGCSQAQGKTEAIGVEPVEWGIGAQKGVSNKKKIWGATKREEFETLFFV